MLRGMGIETVRRKHAPSAEKLEAIGRHDEMKVSGFATDGAIALGNLDSRRRRDLEPDASTVTTSSVLDHGILSFNVLVCRGPVQGLDTTVRWRPVGTT